MNASWFQNITDAIATPKMMSKSEEYIFATIYGLTALCNVVGNTLILLVMVRIKSMRTPVNYLLLNLAVADMFVGIPSVASHVTAPFVDHPRGLTGTIFCKLLTSDSVSFIGGRVSAFTFAVIACERFQAVVYPYKTVGKITTKRTVSSIITCWTVAVAVMIPWMQLAELDQSTGHCGKNGENADLLYNVYIYINSFTFGVPAIIIFLLYGRVVWELVRSANQVINFGQMAANRMKKRVTMMLVATTVVYLATWGPVTVYHCTKRNVRIETVSYHVSTLLICINSSVNAGLYALFSTQFRQSFKRVFRCSLSSQNRTTTFGTQQKQVQSRKIPETTL